jgi:hypothetical protein
MIRWWGKSGKHSAPREQRRAVRFTLLVYGRDGGLAAYGPCDLQEVEAASSYFQSPAQAMTTFDVTALPLEPPGTVLLA